MECFLWGFDFASFPSNHFSKLFSLSEQVQNGAGSDHATTASWTSRRCLLFFLVYILRIPWPSWASHWKYSFCFVPTYCNIFHNAFSNFHLIFKLYQPYCLWNAFHEVQSFETLFSNDISNLGISFIIILKWSLTRPPKYFPNTNLSLFFHKWTSKLCLFFLLESLPSTTFPSKVSLSEFAPNGPSWTPFSMCHYTLLLQYYKMLSATITWKSNAIKLIAYEMLSTKLHFLRTLPFSF